ncbi:hypothetical protein VPHPS15B6_0048 [Vibrio phage PS15B-6]
MILYVLLEFSLKIILFRFDDSLLACFWSLSINYNI